jgi:uncharacterized protein (TIGR00369 family)
MKFSDQKILELNENPLYQAVGIRVQWVVDGSAEAVLEAKPAMCWPNAGRPHGGVLFTVLDTTMAFAAISNGEDGSGGATVDCNIQYTAPADHGPFLCRVATTSKTSRTVFIRGELVDSRGKVVALAQGKFKGRDMRQHAEFCSCPAGFLSPLVTNFVAYREMKAGSASAISKPWQVSFKQL